MAEGQAGVLGYWRAVELFSPQKIPRLNPNSRKEPVFRGGGKAPLPWDASHWFQEPDPEKQWRFTAHCGLYKLGRVRALLEREFGRDRASFDRRPDGESCLFAVQITGGGRPLLDTVVLSSCPWAAGQVARRDARGDAWLSGFEAAAREQALSFAERFAVLENDAAGRALNAKPGVYVGRPIQPNDLEVEIERVAEALGVVAVLRPEGVRLAARQVGEKYAFEANSDDFLNSFFLRDLERLSDEAKHSNLGGALGQYLTADDAVETDRRCDIRTSPDLLWQTTSPRLVPAGRWPAEAAQSLYFSQQCAVNAALQEFKKGTALFGVNGPPGTGKTTLLRDLVAAVVLQRAQVLARLPNPAMAFTTRAGHWQSGDYRRTIHPWREDLLGFGMVVASSNNRAVENVTLEIPAIRAVAEEFIGQIDHFADFAMRILGEGRAWGLVAARLGNKKNRSRFVSRFWFADKEAAEPRTRAEKGFFEYLKSVKPKALAWKKAVARFDDALKQEGVLRNAKAAAWYAMEKRAALTEVQNGLRSAIEAEKACKDELAEAIEDRRQHREFKPGLVDALFTRGSSYREWREKDLRLASKVEQREVDLTRARVERERLSNQREVLVAQIEKLDREVPACPEAPAIADWLEKPEERELSSPWADEEWNRARTRVFIEALHLHRTFLECAAKKMRENLSAAMDILGGKVSPELDATLLQSTWASLFFVVPVISTTFASFDRLFAHCGRESIGWLLIDEAGQAVPQAAAGALWRAKRALVLGDPRQLQPIVTLPFTAQQALRSHFGVEETWMPSRNSVQTLADRVSTLGTWITAENVEQPIWVGSPLRVHRRCENPMFQISNQIAYSGQMVFDTESLPSSLPDSRWIDAGAMDAEDHWIPAEGVAVQMLLRELLQAGVKPDSMLLISPFRAVACRLKEMGARYGITQAGTIHVSQGKEADIVILVLGGDPRRPGAKEWASEKPNLLNVAVSRAKRRLYVIGDREEWGEYPNFADAKALLTSGAKALMQVQ